MMDCTQAQQVLSEAADREPISPATLSEARAHCQGCTECARFVQGLALLQMAEAPAVPDALHDRVMSAIASERAAEAVLDDAASTATPAQAASAAYEPHLPPGDVSRRRPDRRRTFAWVGAAAAVVLVAGLATGLALQGAFGPNAATRGTAVTAPESATDQNAAKDDSAGVGTAGEVSGSAPQSLATPSTSAAPDFIAVEGIVYRSVGDVALDASEIATAGTTTTALDDSSSPRERTVFSTPQAGRVVIVSNGRLLAFDLVTRRLAGREYRLVSDPIETFGLWPSLPARFPTPAAANGAPTFAPGQTDDLGVRVFLRPGIPVERGFAVAPGEAQSDPAAGNPNWTWWEPSER